MVLILIIIMLIILRMYLLTNFITMQRSNSCSEDTNAHAQLIHVAKLMNTLINMASNSRSNLCRR